MTPAYCIINEATNRLHRVTFSRSLAQHIVSRHAPECRVFKAMPVRAGRVVREQVASLYGVVDSKSGHLLRIPIKWASACLYTECYSRHIESVKLEIIGPISGKK